MSDFVEDMKCSCAREGVVFENEFFNELVSSTLASSFLKAFVPTDCDEK
jgi:hypothetical protein